MAVAILEANHSQLCPFMVPVNNTVIVDIEASGLVDIYFLKNKDELQSFKNGKRDFSTKFTGRLNYNATINLAKLWNPNLLGNLSPIYSIILPGAEWYLIIANQSLSNPIAISWRVYNSLVPV